ncbi:MAG: prolyl oligopeptidase family serine peptidase [Pirellulales bacterium]
MNALLIPEFSRRRGVLPLVFWSVVFGGLTLTVGPFVARTAAAERARRSVPPPTRQVDQVDEYHGLTVADPYRWLEQTQLEQTRNWAVAQNQATREFLDRQPQRTRLRQRLAQLWHYERASIPLQFGGKYFFQRNTGGGSQPVLHWAEQLDGPTRPLLDPNVWSRSGDAALSGWRVSRTGRFLAYGTTVGGSDWRTIRVRETASGRDFPEELVGVKFSDLAWTHDERGFFYSRYDVAAPHAEASAPLRCQRLYYHHVGESQSQDALIYERPDEPEWAFDPEVSDDGRWLIVRVWRGADARTQIFVKDLSDDEDGLRPLFQGFESTYRFVGAAGASLIFLTDHEAPRGKLIAVLADDLDEAAPRQLEFVGESAEVLRDANLIGDAIVARYLHNAAAKVVVYELDGRRRYELKFSEPSTVEGMAGAAGDRETFFAATSYTRPTVIYRLELASGECTVFHAPRLASRADEWEVQQVAYPSRDGTIVPMTILSKKGLPRDGDQPTLLYGYGGFNICLTPYFSVTNLVWLEMGGVLAVPNVRGGGEFGSQWHAAGCRELKQNSIDDFIAAAEWLVKEKYTNRRRLAISGKSNGGMLVGAALTQRPDLFAAALPGVGVYDMLRYQRFTIGWAWASEYGTADDPRDFRALLAYSPLHNVRRGGEYPATLVTTSDHDDRVVPAHSYKFAAALQAAQAADRPVLLRVESRAGHGAGLPADKLLDAAADALTFLSATLDIQP